jgi:signal peptide peptidase SppA
MRLQSLISWLPVERLRHPPPVVAVVPLSGLIGGIGVLRRGLTLQSVAGVLERAFTLKGGKAVALLVNSPGGSPVQSALIAGRIRALAAEHRRPVYAFAEDVAASGGYWLLTAGDELWADESSIVGSIGVISAGFGFPDALRRLGVERRVYSSGAQKGALDPFREENPDDISLLKEVQEDVHEAFRRQVRERRAGRLKAGEDELFSGRFWSGRAAVELGLIDGLGDLRTVMRERFGNKVKLRKIADGRPWWRRKIRAIAADRATSGLDEVPERLLAALEERLIWSRYGL